MKLFRFAAAIALLIVQGGTAIAQSVNSEPLLDPARTPGRPSGVLVAFEGGAVQRNILAVLMLSTQVRIPTRSVTFNGETSVCEFLMREGLPPPCEIYANAIVLMNRNSFFANPYVRPVGIVQMPDISVKMYRGRKTFSKLDPKENYLPQSIEKNWSHLRVEKRANSQADDDREQWEYDAYRIFFTTNGDDQAEQFLAAIYASANPNIRAESVVQIPSTVKSAMVKIPPYQPMCADQTATKRVIEYIEFAHADKDAKQVIKDSLPLKPVDVRTYVVDTQVVYPPNLSPPVVAGLGPVGWTCKWAQFNRGNHATHLAGIIASVGHGFRGLAPSAKINSILWAVPDAANANLLRSAIDRQEKLIKSIYFEDDRKVLRSVFLAAIDFGPRLDNYRKPLANLLNVDRFERPTEGAIKDGNALFIVAAGQAENDSQPIALGPLTNEFPANLGDLPNVVVVTACEECSPTAPKLMPSANYSQPAPIRYVHIAAPGGKNIPGWISLSEIGEAYGTSQAAAYVAGVAASMIANYPDEYTKAVFVKTRLQVVSKPLGLNANGQPHADAAKINAGFIDPILALLDPSKHWLKAGGKWEEIKIKAMAPSVDYDSVLGARVKLSTISVLRIAQVSTAGQWVLYLRGEGINRKDVVRTSVLQVPDGASAKLFELCNGRSVYAEQIQDFIPAMSGLQEQSCGN